MSAIRQTTHILKNSDIVNRPLPSSLLPGEPIVNTADGIMYFSGVTTSTQGWTPAGTGATELTFFEVGSNLYDLQLRNQITKYQGQTGAGLDGKFLSGTTNGFVLANIDDINTFSAFTYANNTFSIYESNGEVNSVTVNYFTGLTITGNFNVTGDTTLEGLTASTIYVSGFVPTQVVYVGPNGQLKGENNFSYNESTDTLNVDNIEVSSNVVIQGDLTVLGAAISAFTSNLYVEDPNLQINYNPTGSTDLTSVNAGFTIQDGNGVSLGDVNLDIIRMQNLTGLTLTQIPVLTEYTGPTGYQNRGWITQLNDIVIRSSSVTDNGSLGDINGVRVLAEFDILDGGTY